MDSKKTLFHQNHFTLNTKAIQRDVSIALSEDLGYWDRIVGYEDLKQAQHRDVTTSLIKTDATRHRFRVITREQSVLCGIPWFESACHAVAPQTTIQWNGQDGDLFDADDLLCTIEGPCALLTAERTALNFLQTLSGVATQTYAITNAYPQLCILDTRKTIPGLRYAQKYAVQCGGGYNHRMGLHDVILLKDNHLAVIGSVSNAIQIARNSYPSHLIEVEINDIEMLQEAIFACPDIIMLDNMSNHRLEEAVQYVRQSDHPHIALEYSGGLTGDHANIPIMRQIDYVSMGCLTKHIRAIDLSMQAV